LKLQLQSGGAVPSARSYDDPCGIARALDRVGERWALLVVRELVLGPKRFTDLRAGLPGASPNVLAQRLRELEQAGVVQRRKLDPPASAWVYELSPWGADLEPVVLALARWGSRAAPVPRGELSVDALLLALKTTFDPAAAGDLRARLELRLGDERFEARVARGRFDVTRGRARDPDAVLATDAARLRRLVFAGDDLDAALRAGAVRLEGDRRVAARFLGCFRRPAPAVAAP
jgi:DNA-binding HxlR family transcriptional regulator